MKHLKHKCDHHYCLKPFHSSPIPTGSSPNSSVRPSFPTCPVLTESCWAFYQHGRFLPTPARDSHPLVHTFLCLDLSRPSSKVILPINGLWFPPELVHLSTSTHPTPAWPGLLPAPMTWLIRHIRCNTSCSLTLTTALYLRDPQLYKFILKEFPLSEEE